MSNQHLRFGEREPLPSRGEMTTISMIWLWNNTESRWSISMRRYADGRPAEVFIQAPKIGSEIESLVQDACVLVSHLLQRGMPFEQLHKALSREGIMLDAPAGSIIGLIVQKMGEMLE